MKNNAIQKTTVQTVVTDLVGGASTTRYSSATIWACPHPSEPGMAHVRFGGSTPPSYCDTHSQVVRATDCRELADFFHELAVVLGERELRTKKGC